MISCRLVISVCLGLLSAVAGCAVTPPPAGAPPATPPPLEGPPATP
jgi:hypothetical protein